MMARPRKEGMAYFSFDVDFFSNKKIKILKARYGSDGITIFLYLLCEIYKNGYYLKIDDDFEFIISDDLNMDCNKVKQVLNFLLERSLFDNKLFQSDKVLTSAGIQKRFQLAVKSRASKNPITIKDFWIEFFCLTPKSLILIHHLTLMAFGWPRCCDLHFFPQADKILDQDLIPLVTTFFQ